ncbi:C6 zinc finger domain protein [Colletotrichum truncatum]|uniref:C6 zinc finger domain protein n=1 Tax=Colletotrichum truncatum TaxID=5467 RepID=A0ACC3YLT0_COLTU|nr:C6 zinc finger domain protein [Colletotrichum truncatum]KAF6781946.1 C6 zinc finger domain protein [Colletotrichum truncatum]
MGETSPAKGASKSAAIATGLVTFAVDGRPRTHRNKTGKSRSGCVTCKKRRIRCDEAKPTCLNCTKSKRTCEGYIQKPAAGASKLAGESRSLLIKPNYEANIFTNQLEKDHFDYWMTFTKEFSLFPSDLMTQLLPQIARDEPAIRHAAFAIGAATMNTHTRLQRTTGTGPFKEEALKHYGKAISIVRNSEPSRKSIPRALLSCLLFVTFEALQGNRKTALAHINHGCNMLDQITRLGVSGNCPPKLIQEVHSSFRRFTLLSWSLNGLHPQETESYVPWCCRGWRTRYAIDELPPSFSDLGEAEKWWEIVQHHVIYQSKIKSGWAFEGLQHNNPEPMTKISTEDAQKYLGVMERWRERFRPLTKGALREKTSNQKAYLQMVSLRIHYLSLELLLKTLYYSDLEVLASSTPTFKAIVSLCRIVLKGQDDSPQSAKEVFTMDSGPTLPLVVAGVFCVDAETREEAHQLFRDYPRRDAIYDSRVFEATLRSTQVLRAETSEDHEEVCREILRNKQIIFGDDVIRRRTYQPDDGSGTWRVTLEQTTPLEPSKQGVRFVRSRNGDSDFL